MTILKFLISTGIVHQKVLLRIIISSSTEEKLYVQPLDSSTERYKEIQTLTTDQAEDFSSECVLDYEYIKAHYRLIAVDLHRQKELDADPKENSVNLIHWTT